MPKVCPSLPSAEVAYDLVSPNLTALPAMLGTVAFRALLIGYGLRFAGGKDRPHLFRDSLCASLVIESFVLGWALRNTYGL